MTALVPVMAARRLRTPNRDLLARMAAELALICDWPDR